MTLSGPAPSGENSLDYHSCALMQEHWSPALILKTMRCYALQSLGNLAAHTFTMHIFWKQYIEMLLAWNESKSEHEPRRKGCSMQYRAMTVRHTWTSSGEQVVTSQQSSLSSASFQYFTGCRAPRQLKGCASNKASGLHPPELWTWPFLPDF